MYVYLIIYVVLCLETSVALFYVYIENDVCVASDVLCKEQLL